MPVKEKSNLHIFMKKILLLLVLVFAAKFSFAQTGIGGDSNVVDYNAPREYTLVKVNFIGAVNLNPDILVLISGLPVGDKIMIPGEKTADAIDNIWREGLVDDISITVNKIEGDYVWLDMNIVEKPMI